MQAYWFSLLQEFIIFDDYIIFMAHFGQSDNYRRDELIRIIEHSVEKLTLQELEALYYDMETKNYIFNNH